MKEDPFDQRGLLKGRGGTRVGGQLHRGLIHGLAESVHGLAPVATGGMAPMAHGASLHRGAILVLLAEAARREGQDQQ